MGDRCVCCGDLIPEGRHVCLRCEKSKGAGVSYLNRIIRGASNIDEYSFEYDHLEDDDPDCEVLNLD